MGTQVLSTVHQKYSEVSASLLEEVRASIDGQIDFDPIMDAIADLDSKRTDDLHAVLEAVSGVDLEPLLDAVTKTTEEMDVKRKTDLHVVLDAVSGYDVDPLIDAVTVNEEPPPPQGKSVGFA